MRPAATCADLKASLGRWQAGLADVGWNSLYWDNHDQPRVVSRFGDDGRVPGRVGEVLATVLHLHRGTPYVYQGEELGMTNYPFAADRRLPRHRVAQPLRATPSAAGETPDAVLAALRAMSRDNARTPVQWDAAAHAGFTHRGTPVDRGEPQPRASQRRSPARRPATRCSPTTGALIELRHTDPVVADGDFTMLLPHDPQVYAFTRALGDARLLVLANLASAPADIEVPDGAAWAGAQVLLASGGVTGSDSGVDPTGRWRAAPWEALVLRVPLRSR